MSLSRKQTIPFLALALLAFVGLGLEVLLALAIEPLLYGKEMGEWETTEYILHWVITCIVWGVLATALMVFAQKRLSFNVWAAQDKLRPANWLVCLVILVALIAVSTVRFHGIPVIQSFQSLGLLKFVFQHIYYAFEALLVLLIIVFGQRAGECAVARQQIPWGGTLAGLTWGLVHILTKGDVATGLFGCLYGLLFGVIYLAARKNTGVAYVFILLAFIY
ncbi:MAG: hypothetical protein LBR39_00870 [Coriobacteriales bacterium]|jgi:hypothetical protein|nr:hypothetical protein [Coriobacteriales bacterium]